MPKKMFTVRDFSGGINTVQDPRDIDKREFTYLSNFYVDQLGALRPSGSLISHNGLVANKNITSASGCIIEESGGRNLFYFESDHDIGSSAGITSGTVKFFTGGTFTGSGNSMSPAPTYSGE
jgi:hypothetical protein